MSSDSKYPRKSPVTRMAAGAALVVVGVALLCVPVVLGVRFADRFGMLFLWLAVAAIALLALARLFRVVVPPFPSKMILSLDLTNDISEEPADGPMSKIPGQSTGPTLYELVDGLQRAAGDKRVVGLFARIEPGLTGAAKVAEVRDAIEAFRASGKPTVAFSESFGEFAPAGGSYHLATAFDEIVLQPSGDVGLVGAMAEPFFLRGALDKAGVKSQMDHRYEFKNAMNMFTEKKFTRPHRLAMARILESQFETSSGWIAEGRKMSAAEVRTLVDRGPFLGEEAVDEGLVDRLAYRDQVIDRMKEQAGKGTEMVGFSKWADKAKKKSRGVTVALIYGCGPVTQGKSRFTIPFGKAMGSETVAGAIRSARRDKSVKAIVFRVDSPGGSYVASDTIWREVVRAKVDGKPVIATMGNVAGSGGYFVAMPADKIVAQPGTLTGSIGVLGGKHVLAALKERFGVTTDSVQIGAAASMWSTNHEYNERDWDRFQAWLDRVYDDFTTKAAEGRGMSLSDLQDVAKGRVWTGADALERGLVDELGGYPAAFRLAREAAGLKPDGAIKVKVFPPKKSMVASLREGKVGSWALSAVGIDRVDLSPLEELTGPYLQAAQALSAGEVSMPAEFWSASGL